MRYLGLVVAFLVVSGCGDEPEYGDRYRRDEVNPRSPEANGGLPRGFIRFDDGKNTCYHYRSTYNGAVALSCVVTK